jgi:hypothetical protein
MPAGPLLFADDMASTCASTWTSTLIRATVPHTPRPLPWWLLQAGTAQAPRSITKKRLLSDM